MWLGPSHSVCFLFTEPGLCVNTGLFFSSTPTQRGQLADHEEILAGFDKTCIGLELQTTPFNNYELVYRMAR